MTGHTYIYPSVFNVYPPNLAEFPPVDSCALSPTPVSVSLMPEATSGGFCDDSFAGGEIVYEVRARLVIDLVDEDRFGNRSLDGLWSAAQRTHITCPRNKLSLGNNYFRSIARTCNVYTLVS